MTKICSICKDEKPCSEFYKSSTCKDGYNGQCKACLKKYRQTEAYRIKARERERCYREKHRDRLRHRQAAALRGMTADEREEFLQERDYKCEVCGMSRELSQELFKKDLHIDHCHKTGINKGVLCLLCNGASGRLRDGPDLAFKLWKYLERTRSI